MLQYPWNLSKVEHSRPGCGGEEKNPGPCRASNLDHPSRSVVSISTELSAKTMT
jgi:hypothetical protein